MPPSAAAGTTPSKIKRALLQFHWGCLHWWSPAFARIAVDRNFSISRRFLFERRFRTKERRMPLYFFGLPDDLASPEASEELANDAEARQVAQIVANELSSNRYDGEEIAVLVFNESGQLIHKVWTRPNDAAVATKQRLFPEHVHPQGFYQI
jgi:hypothetical protein